jgi:hypothetical protein
MTVKYGIGIKDPRQFITQLQGSLLLIETKGAGVEHMYMALKAVKELYDSIYEIKEEAGKSSDDVVPVDTILPVDLLEESIKD